MRRLGFGGLLGPWAVVHVSPLFLPYPSCPARHAQEIAALTARLASASEGEDERARLASELADARAALARASADAAAAKKVCVCVFTACRLFVCLIASQRHSTAVIEYNLNAQTQTHTDPFSHTYAHAHTHTRKLFHPTYPCLPTAPALFAWFVAAVCCRSRNTRCVISRFRVFEYASPHG